MCVHTHTHTHTYTLLCIHTTLTALFHIHTHAHAQLTHPAPCWVEGLPLVLTVGTEASQPLLRRKCAHTPCTPSLLVCATLSFSPTRLNSIRKYRRRATPGLRTVHEQTLRLREGSGGRGRKWASQQTESITEIVLSAPKGSGGGYFK